MSDTTTESMLCINCMHRMYNTRSEVLCSKKHEQEAVGFYCGDYVSEDVYEYKSYLMTDDKQSVSETKVRYVFIWFVLFQIAGMIFDSFRAIHSFGGWVFSLLFTLTWVAVIVALYYGRAWARLFTNAVLLLSFVTFFFLFGSGTLSAEGVIPMALVAAYNGYFLYFINADRDFRRHFEKRK